MNRPLGISAPVRSPMHESPFQPRTQDWHRLRARNQNDGESYTTFRIGMTSFASPKNVPFSIVAFVVERS